MQKERLQKLNGWARQNLTQYILPFWTSDFIIDHEYGGFYGRVSASIFMAVYRPPWKSTTPNRAG